MTKGEKDNRQTIDACRHMNALGINQGTSGIFGVCHQGGPLIGQLPLPPSDEIKRVRRKMARNGRSDG
jgi:hypothetical protein